MNKEQEIRDSAQNAIAHAQLIGLPIGAEVDRITDEFKTTVLTEGVDPASVLSTIESLYEQLLTELVSQTIQRTIEIVQRYITSDQKPEKPKMATQSIQLLELIQAQQLPWETKAREALLALQKTGALNLLALKLQAGMIESKADRYFINSILPESRQLSAEELSDLQILEVFPNAALEVGYLERLEEISSNRS